MLKAVRCLSHVVVLIPALLAMTYGVWLLHPAFLLDCTCTLLYFMTCFMLATLGALQQNGLFALLHCFGQPSATAHDQNLCLCLRQQSPSKENLTMIKKFPKTANAAGPKQRLPGFQGISSEKTKMKLGLRKCCFRDLGSSPNPHASKTHEK